MEAALGSMDSSQGHECNGCGRTFTQTNAFSYHLRTCKKSKVRLSSALATARENWTRLKKARLSGPDPPPSNSSSSHDFSETPSTSQINPTSNATISDDSDMSTTIISPSTPVSPLVGVAEVREVKNFTQNLPILFFIYIPTFRL